MKPNPQITESLAKAASAITIDTTGDSLQELLEQLIDDAPDTPGLLESVQQICDAVDLFRLHLKLGTTSRPKFIPPAKPKWNQDPLVDNMLDATAKTLGSLGATGKVFEGQPDTQFTFPKEYVKDPNDPSYTKKPVSGMEQDAQALWGNEYIPPKYTQLNQQEVRELIAMPGTWRLRVKLATLKGVSEYPDRILNNAEIVTTQEDTPIGPVATMIVPDWADFSSEDVDQNGMLITRGTDENGCRRIARLYRRS